MVALNFDLLPDLSSQPLFITLKPGVDEMLEREFPLAYARLEASIKFTWYIHSNSLHANEPKATRIREAFLRASLAEYASADEALKRDVESKGGDDVLMIKDCPEPHIRLVKELRNLEIHLHSSELNKDETDIVIELDGETHERQTTIWKTEPLTEARLKSLRNSRHFSKSEITRMVSWFNEAQDVWGADHVVYLAASSYAEKLCQYYQLA